VFGDPDEAVLEIRYRKIRVLPPIGKQKRYPSLTLTVIHAEERGPPKNRKKIDWKLIADLPVGSRADAIEKLEWYALRWKIEVFHKILKSGCKAEESKLRTAQRLANLVSVFCILSWRVFWMTMLNRSAPDALPTLVLTATEIAVLDRLVSDKPPARRKTLSHYLTKIARLGGYLARANDPPPGNTVMWRGLSRLTDIALGAMSERKLWVPMGRGKILRCPDRAVLGRKTCSHSSTHRARAHQAFCGSLRRSGSHTTSNMSRSAVAMDRARSIPLICIPTARFHS
jgi:hypothetical protein